MKTIFSATFTLFLVLAAFAAFAAEAVAPGSGQTVFDGFFDKTLQPVINSILAVVVTGAVTYITAMLKRKFGIEISEATTARLRGIAWDAVHVVEEKAATAVKTGGDKWLSEAKHAAAINYILAKVPALSQDEADSLVQAALAKVKGLGATAALGT